MDDKITSCSSFDYCKQYEAPSEQFPEGRWFVRREPYRDGVVGLVKNALARVAGAWQVRPEDDLDRLTAELINISSECSQGGDQGQSLTRNSLHRGRRAAAPARAAVRLLPDPRLERVPLALGLPGRGVHVARAKGAADRDDGPHAAVPVGGHGLPAAADAVAARPPAQGARLRLAADLRARLPPRGRWVWETLSLCMPRAESHQMHLYVVL